MHVSMLVSYMVHLVHESTFVPFTAFFTVKNHGIPDERIDDVVAASRRFFSLPLEEKMKVLL